MKASAGKRVLMLLENDHYPQDGRVRLQATSLVAAGYQVTVICPATSRQSWHEVVNGINVFRYPSPPSGSSLFGYLWEYGYSLLAMFALSLLVCLGPGFDIIHAANPPDTAVLIAVPYKLIGKRFIYDHHDLAPEMYWERFEGKGSPAVHRALLWLERFSCQLADHVIATNQSYKTIEMQRCHVPEERITIVRNGPALDQFQPVSPDEKLRQKARIIIGYVGLIAPQDGLDYLLRALHHLMKDLRRTDFFCVIIGKRDPSTNLSTLAAELGLDDHVWLTGWISDADLIRFLSTADICVDPDPSNPFNDRCTMIKMMEYMALAKPIVAFDLPEHRFTAQEAALYARANDELDFARKIAALMDDPTLRLKMGQKGRERVENELAWSHQEQHLLDAYGDLMKPVQPVHESSFRARTG